MISAESAVLADHAFLRGMPAELVALLADAAAPISVPAGHRLFDEGAPAENCWLLTGGQVALDLPMPGRPNLIVETLGSGDVIGFSWLSPPHEWQFGAQVLEPPAPSSWTARSCRRCVTITRNSATSSRYGCWPRRSGGCRLPGSGCSTCTHRLAAVMWDDFGYAARQVPDRLAGRRDP